MFFVCPAVLMLAFTVQASGPASRSDSATVAKRLQVVRSIANDLQSDAAEMSAAARSSTGGRVWLPNREKFLRDIRDLKETASELLELEQIASARQTNVIEHLKPLLRDLGRNTKALMEHVEAGPDQTRAGAYTDYVAAHEEITKRLIASISETIEHPEQVGPRRPRR